MLRSIQNSKFKIHPMPIHLVSYATPKYRHRQILLAASAKANGIVASARSWTPASLKKSQFTQLAPDIKLSERGAGFWAWKPFIILQALLSVPEGDTVFYCDVGRKYPYILLQHQLEPYISWMDDHTQDIIPGVLIPWNGPMSRWTKSDAFVGTGMDRPECHNATPIQASFSFWRASPPTRQFLNDWLSWCVQRHLVSDDPNVTGRPNASEFLGHRHDQSLLTLCCIKHNIQGIHLGNIEPSFNERDPGMVAKSLFSSLTCRSFMGKFIHHSAKSLGFIELIIRERVKFGRSFE
jgi:hypothetical protein